MTTRSLPRWVLVPAALAALLVLLPLAGMLVRVPWAHVGAVLTAPSSLTALSLSLRTALASTALCVVLGVPLALVLARSTTRGLSALRALVLLPLVLPPVVGGLALLYTFGRMGLLGPSLRVLGLDIAFTTTAVVLAQTFVALPFLVVSLEGALRTVGTRYEQVAAGLGASPTRTLWRVTLPLARPALFSGTALAFARCLGEFGATLTFAGSLEGITRTLPLEIYLQRETDPDQAVALSLLLVLFALLVVALTHPSRRRRGAGFLSQLASFAGQRGRGSRRATAVRSGSRAVAASAGTDVTPSTPALAVDVHHEPRGVAAAFEVHGGSVAALVGPNGAGKSTVLAVIAGLLAPTWGSVHVGSRTVADVGEARRTWVPAHRRGVALMAQEPLLFPHLSVLENVAFGPRSQGVARQEARFRAGERLRQVGAGQFAARAPSALSGGQAQRVAIARVLAAEPEVILLDEPLSALDVTARPAVRDVLRRVLSGRTAVIVTHDPADVDALAHQVVRLEG